MALEVGERLGPYVIAGSVGAGGMGEVYRARDTRLDRDVAIKVIPASMARDPERVARFEREARAVAALSHPNILTIHDTGIAGETLYVVMELLEGETLGDRLRQGPLPIRKACEIGQLIARGLAAAHEKDIVHRDLKPGNIFLTSDGQVKILDFGLARSLTESTGGSETRPAITNAGGVLGTVGYMAPEQVRGLAADPRADLFALGVVLYEMVSGQRAFSRGTAAETMTAILNDDAPDLQSGTRPVPAALDRVIRHCLEKNPAERFQTARDVAFALDALSGSSAAALSMPATAAGRHLRERAAWTTVTMALAALAVWLAVGRPAPSAPSEAYRASVLLPEGVSLTTAIGPGVRFAVSPDGQHLAFVGESTARGRALWIQSLSDGSAIMVEGSKDAEAPFWAPDSRTVGFFTDGRLMKKDAAGARALPIASGRGTAAWSPNGQQILVADEQSGVRLVSVVDGSSRELFAAKPGILRFFPTFLPEGGRFLFGQYELGAGLAWYGSDLNGAAPVVLKRPQAGGDDHSNVVIASGHVLWVRDQNLLARPVALDLGQAGAPADGETTVIAAPVDALPRISGAFSPSQTGVLVYQVAASSNRSILLWHNRNGARGSPLGAESDYSNLEVSPDGTRLLVTMMDPAKRTRDIWLFDLVRGVPTRLTFEPTDERSAVWSTDGQSIVYRGHDGELYIRPLGRGEEHTLLADKRSKDPDGWSSDGKHLLYRTVGKGNDLWIKPAAAGEAPYPFVATPFSESYGQFSPDGHWVAYVSDETGSPEVYVTNFPSGQGKTRVSSDGGLFPRWRKDGRELYFLSADEKMMMATVVSSPKNFQIQVAKVLFQTTVVTTGGVPYVVSDDGQRFLINSKVPSTAPPSLGVIFNWPALVRKR